MFTWLLGAAQHTLAGVIIQLKAFLIYCSYSCWKSFMLLKYNLGGLPGSVASGRWLSIQEAEQPWKATVQHALSFGSVLCDVVPFSQTQNKSVQISDFPENKHRPLKKSLF